MINKIVPLLFLILIVNLFHVNTSANEQFNFDVTELEILENGNIIKGSKKGSVKTNDGIIIISDTFIYDKEQNIFTAIGNVNYKDFNRNIEIFSEKIVYNKNKEVITTQNNSKAIYDKSKIINADSFVFKKSENIAMFCTGGIRCEKANIYLKKKGFKNIYVLNGGIINYLNSIDKKNSEWKGECFVFDNRVSIKHGLKQGSYSVCSGCRKPLSIKEKKSSKYLEGIHCPKCHDYLTDDQKSRFAMRQKQIILAKKTGKRHIFKKEY